MQKKQFLASQNEVADFLVEKLSEFKVFFTVLQEDRNIVTSLLPVYASAPPVFGEPPISDFVARNTVVLKKEIESLDVISDKEKKNLEKFKTTAASHVMTATTSHEISQLAKIEEEKQESWLPNAQQTLSMFHDSIHEGLQVENMISDWKTQSIKLALPWITIDGLSFTQWLDKINHFWLEILGPS